jgi:hypothetical protein
MRLTPVLSLALTFLGCKGSPPSAPPAYDDAGPPPALVNEQRAHVGLDDDVDARAVLDAVR